MKRTLTQFGIAVAFVLIGTTAKAQSDIMYFMYNTPQSSFLNPAFGVKTGTYLSIPVISGMDLNFNASGFSYSDLVVPQENSDAVKVSPLNLFNKLGTQNDLSLSGSVNIFGMGFQFGEGHLSVDLTLDGSARAGLNQSLIGFMFFGSKANLNAEDFVYDDKILDMSLYLSPSVSFARELGEKLTVGARLGLLLGLMDITTERSDIEIKNTGAGKTIQSNIEILSSSFIGKVESNQFSVEDPAWVTDNFGTILANAVKNPGVVLDLGASYKLNDKMEISASVNDLGYIYWSANPTKISSYTDNYTYVYEGIGNSFDSLSNDFDNYFDALKDTLKHIFDLKAESTDSYGSMIPVKFNVGYSWNFAGPHSLFAHYKGIKGNGYYDSYFSLYYNLAWKFLSFTIGNTFSRHNYLHPALALNINGGGFNVYLGGSFCPREFSLAMSDLSSSSVFLGINFLLGKK
ncbi:MAG: DUF5723 family protein [Bacteroidales bacterium]|jgi:hypothetical protein|nr:DUF5723 family protein [Bacteroidales bacterium]